METLEQDLNKKLNTDNDSQIQPDKYTEEELSKLREIIEIIKQDESRSALACWGNYSDYNHGY